MSAAPRVVRESALDWVKFDAQLARDGSVPPVEKALYAALGSFADQGDRETPAGWDWEDDVPTRAVLAKCIGKSKDTVDRATKGLEARGLLEVERRQDPDNPRLNIPSVYRLLDQERWDDRAAERVARRRAARSGGGRMDAARGGRMDAARGGRMDAARGGRMDAAPSFSEEVVEEDLSLAAPVTPASVGTAPVGERENVASPEGQNPSGAEVPPQREPSPQNAAAGRVVDAYAAALGRPVLAGTRTKLERQAVELLGQSLPEAWLCDRARELAARGWSDLVQHVERSTAPIEGQREVPGAGRPGLPEWCGECGDGTGTAARLNPRFRKIGPEDARELCPRCHPDRVASTSA
ncbi:helix-turn-helix domain-containing protein [Streptomyces sp. MBT33]|uniref:helix-turn-helix domain-containing protein n=1 Tax=Streptomyces sp. MBT33 TaxID=1488363 RepID=UPI00190DDE52|nr:helix-turn-helix domain-containing protein [Streptomyces sp. MBT33]MBK3647812.1 helix-turn-helix domain-containing protein [Streptomyces sp. MBT33]